MDSLFGTIRLGTLIGQLRLLPPELPVRFDFAGFAPAGFSSYRGWYDHLAIQPERIHYPEGTTGEFLIQLQKNAINTVFTGYKGGKYRMTEETPVWVSYHDEASGTGIVAVHRGAAVNIIETKHIDM